MNWYIKVIKNYAVFSGRSRRMEYWYFTLFNIIFMILVSFLDHRLGTFNFETETGLLSTVYSIVVLIPSIAVGVRRLHDIGRTGWWILIGLVPIIGAIVLFIFFIKDGDIGENIYGSDPKISQ